MAGEGIEHVGVEGEVDSIRGETLHLALEVHRVEVVAVRGMGGLHEAGADVGVAAAAHHAVAVHKGPAFSNYFELRDRVAEREPDFARGFTEALIAYALGRPFAFTDEDLAKEILTVAKSKEHSVSEFVQALVLSEAFKWKKG